MCDWKVFTVMLVVDQLTIFVESSPVPLVAHPNKFIGIGILIVYAPFNVSEFLVSYTHCLFSVNNHICIMSRLFTYANFDVALIKGPNNSRRIVIRANVRHMSSISRFAEINWECII